MNTNIPMTFGFRDSLMVFYLKTNVHKTFDVRIRDRVNFHQTCSTKYVDFSVEGTLTRVLYCGKLGTPRQKNKRAPAQSHQLIHISPTRKLRIRENKI